MSAFLDRVRNLDVPPSAVGGVPTPDSTPAGGAAPVPSGSQSPQNTPPAIRICPSCLSYTWRHLPGCPAGVAYQTLAPGEWVELYGR